MVTNGASTCMKKVPNVGGLTFWLFENINNVRVHKITLPKCFIAVVNLHLMNISKPIIGLKLMISVSLWLFVYRASEFYWRGRL